MWKFGTYTTSISVFGALNIAGVKCVDRAEDRDCHLEDLHFSRFFALLFALQLLPQIYATRNAQVAASLLQTCCLAFKPIPECVLIACSSLMLTSVRQVVKRLDAG